MTGQKAALDIKSHLNSIGLDANNSIVVASGILNALGIRRSNDIDVVVSQKTYQQLASSSRFSKKQACGQSILADDIFEILSSYNVAGKVHSYRDLLPETTVIDNLRYISLEFLLSVKQGLSRVDNVRQKDVDDVKLIESYLLKKNKRSARAD